MELADRGVADERRQAGPCPSCGSDAAVPIFYGMPTVADFASLQGGGFKR